MVGVALASNVGQSEEFVSLRDYRRGDPLRHIHWRSWAKAGKPVVKEFEDEFFVRHALVLDTFIDDPHSELFEEAVSVAASFASTVLTQRIASGPIICGRLSPIVSQLAAAWRMRTKCWRSWHLSDRARRIRSRCWNIWC